MVQDTIFAPLTIKGKCSVYLIRISGDKTPDCLRFLGIDKKLEDKKATLCKIKDRNNLTNLVASGENKIDENEDKNKNKDKVLDEALITYFKAPNSFTGEDVCEISLHCSSYIIDRVFNILLNIEGVRLAKNGEFSKRAFLNNKLDLTQAEAINDLVNSQTELQHRQAIEQLEGKNSKFFENLKRDILDVNSYVESMIDFPEDDVGENILTQAKNNIDKIINNIKNILNDNCVGEKIKNGLNVSIIGEPNVGKSTFFNFLANEEIAIVSNIEGTTRDILKVSLNIDGVPVNFFDTAGVRETTDIIEKEGVKRALKNAEGADLKILLLSPEKCDFNNIDKIFKNVIGEKTLIIFNKIDLINENDFNKIKIELLEKLAKKINFNGDIIGISLKEKKNTDAILKYLSGYITKNITPYTGTNITQERYRIELNKAVEFLENIDFNALIEIASENIRSASFCIGEITGHINTDEILNNIFSKFCIGK